MNEPYRGRRVLVTGHTGFKGGWLSLALHDLGAEVHGLSLPAEASVGTPNLFSAIELASLVTHREGDIRDAAVVARSLEESKPDLLFHLAAQPLVRRSYGSPLETFSVNTLGTATVLDCIRRAKKPMAVVVVTSDKCYENDGSSKSFREEDPLGGGDPYSASKAAAELVTQAYRRSYFAPAKLGDHGVALASARGGNVLGGGDWAEDRVAADAMRAFSAARPLSIRNPKSTRPFQHVAELVGGYLLLGEKLLSADRAKACRAYNFAPLASATVEELATALAAGFGDGARWEQAANHDEQHEALTLQLDASAAHRDLNWQPRWSCAEAATRAARWYRAFYRGANATALREETRRDMREWLSR